MNKDYATIHFGFFLNQEDKSGTRIDLLFELLAHEYNNQLPNSIPETVKDYFPFLVFAEKQKNVDASKREKQFVDLIWNDIEALYSELRNWYADLDKYHVIGFLIACGSTIQAIRKATQGLRKSEVRTTLNEMVNLDIGKIQWDDLTYTERSADRARIKKILLLFNITTLVCKSEKQYRFPFDLYKNDEWDLEHIHAIKDELPHSSIDTAAYLEALKEEFFEIGKEEVAKQITDFLVAKDKTDKNFRASCVELYERLKSDFQEELFEDNDIRNVTLLNAEINRGYKNVTFMQKRKTIIEREGNGLFIPLCTKNVFLKYYYNPELSENKNWLRWSEQDRKDYIEAMQNIIETFLSGDIAQ